MRERRLQVARLYEMNMTEREIARQLNISQPTVHTDIQTIREEWKKETFRSMDQYLQREVMKLDALERDQQIALQQLRRPPAPDPNTGERVIFTGSVVEVVQSILKIMERRARLLGMDRPERSSAALTEIQVDDDTDELERFNRLIDRLAAAGTAPGSLPELAAGDAEEAGV